MCHRLEELREFMEDPFPEIFGDKWDTLVPREKQVIRLHVLTGQSYTQLQLTLGIAYSTCRNHMNRARHKLEIYSDHGQIRHIFHRELLKRINEILDET
jgi:DNA-directed RNA polymerase specialized sigma24 family protein